MSDWISVKDKLPPVGVGVLVAGRMQVVGDLGFISVPFVTAAQYSPIGNQGSLSVWWDGHCFQGYEWEFDFEAEQVTHWMALPEPPSDI